jgi:hypothetical protein
MSGTRRRWADSRRLAALGLALAGWTTAAGCFAPAYENGRLRCPEGECPEGYYCSTTLRCWRQGTVPPLTEGDADVTSDGPAKNDAAGPADGPLAPPIDGGADQTPPLPGDGPDAEPVEDPAARLLSLEVSPGQLSPAFAPTVLNYGLDLPLFTTSVKVTAAAQDPGATLQLNASTSPSPLSLELPITVGLSRLDLTVLGPKMATSIYHVYVNTGGVVSYVKPPNTHVGMAFGRSVAVSGTTLVVGAPDDKGLGVGPQLADMPVGPTAVGAVFVFARTDLAAGAGARWRREVTLKPLEVQPEMKFGAAVALAGDTLVVGAPGESGADQKADMAGAAYVFVRGVDGWSQQAYLKASDAAVGDQFGSSVAVTTNTTPAGTTTLVAVGAPGASGPNNAVRAGAVYVFARTIAPGVAPTWTQQAMPHPANPKGNNEFGASVALGGDNLVVGSPLEDSGATGVGPGSTSSTAADSGAVFVFTRNGAMWPQSTYIKAPTAATFANFGSKVAIAGQYLVVGAPRDGGGVRNPDGTMGPALASSGAVFVYQRNGNGWSHLQNIKASNAHAADLFGQGLALSPTTLVVGAPFEDSNVTGSATPAALDSGAAYVFRLVDTRWTEFVRLKAPNAEASDNFGNAVATDGDPVVVGAEAEASGERTIDGNQTDNTAPGSGAVYVY